MSAGSPGAPDRGGAGADPAGARDADPAAADAAAVNPQAPDPNALARADHTVSRGGRLIAYIWERPQGGSIRRAGHGALELATFPTAEILVFDRQSEALVVNTAGTVSTVVALLVALGVEGFDVVAGESRPGRHLRRF